MDRPQHPLPRLQPMDFTSLRAVLAEWRSLLLPSRFEKAQQADGQTLELALRSLSGVHWLTLCWQAEAARVHLMAPPPRRGEGSTLAQQLQHGLRGLALVTIEQPPWERVVELGFARRPGEAVERWLVVELMGRHSNLLLLDGERRVIALAHQVRPQQSRLRPIGTGDAYGSPPPLAGEPPRLQESQASWRQRLCLLPLPLRRALLDAYQGVSPALVAQLVPEPWRQLPVDQLEEGQWQQLWQAWRQWLTALEQERFHWQLGPEGYRCWCPEPADAGAEDPCGSAAADGISEASGASAAGSPQASPGRLNRALAAYYGERLQQRQLEQLRQQWRHRLQQATERERLQEQEQQRLLAAVPESEALQRQADALLCQASPSRACIDGAQALYRRARKLRRSLEAIRPRLEHHHRRLAALEASLIYVEQADDPAQLAALIEDLEALLGPRAGRDAVARRRPMRQTPQPLELHTPGGLLVQVGRNHRQNDWISLRQARRGDLWFHAQELPGSHVVLKSSAAPAADQDLQLAADLAAHFSRGRGNVRVPVVMVPAEDLQRIPEAAPGTVRHRGGSVLWGEPQRAAALLAQAS